MGILNGFTLLDLILRKVCSRADTIRDRNSSLYLWLLSILQNKKHNLKLNILAMHVAWSCEIFYYVHIFKTI